MISSTTILLFLFISSCANEMVRPPDEQSTLRELSDQIGFETGTAIDGWQFEDTNWKEVVGREFNQATINWGIYWPAIEPGRGQFDFRTADIQVAFARQNAMAIRGHPLVFAELNPSWLKGGDFSNGELLTILVDHIVQIMTHFKGQIDQWVVVNEPYLYPYRQSDIFYEHFGYDYIEFAFRAAREADPSAILIYNDTGNHIADSETTTLTREMVHRLKSKGLVDAVGIQMHIDGDDPPDKREVISVMKSYDVPVYVTEFDVDMRDVRGTQTERFDRQADIYKDMLGACFESTVCEGFTVWGIGDKFSWLEWPRGGSTSPLADPTPFDEGLQPKPAYYSLLEVLFQHAHP